MTFQTKTISSFKKIKRDFDNFKNNINEWILSLRRTDLELMQRIMILEAKVKELEIEKIRN